MPTTDTGKKGPATLIVESLANEAGYDQGRNEDIDRNHAVDVAKLLVLRPRLIFGYHRVDSLTGVTKSVTGDPKI
jgi:hypothetical protein